MRRSQAAFNSEITALHYRAVLESSDRLASRVLPRGAGRSYSEKIRSRIAICSWDVQTQQEAGEPPRGSRDSWSFRDRCGFSLVPRAGRGKGEGDVSPA